MGARAQISRFLCRFVCPSVILSFKRSFKSNEWYGNILEHSREHLIQQNGRRPSMEENLSWKTTFDGRQRCKMTFDLKGPSIGKVWQFHSWYLCELDFCIWIASMLFLGTWHSVAVGNRSSWHLFISALVHLGTCSSWHLFILALVHLGTWSLGTVTWHSVTLGTQSYLALSHNWHSVTWHLVTWHSVPTSCGWSC